MGIPFEAFLPYAIMVTMFGVTVRESILDNNGFQD